MTEGKKKKKKRFKSTCAKTQSRKIGIGKKGLGHLVI